MDILQQLTAATTDAEREAIVLEMSLAALSPDLQEAIRAAAIPHWFSALFLDALLAQESDDLYDELLDLDFVEYVAGKGYAIHERPRQHLLNNLWQNNPTHFRELSRRAADYCVSQTCETNAKETDDPEWQAEAIYHQLISDPDAGVAGLRDLGTKWANYEYHTYEEIERTVRWANEQIEAGRLTGAGADWTRLWQAKLALMYGRPDLAAQPLNQITADAESDPQLAAEAAETQGDMLAATGSPQAGIAQAWQAAYTLYLNLADGQGQLDAYLVADKMRQHGLPDPTETSDVELQTKKRTSKNELKLIDNISAAWIEGVLQTALDETIDLQMERSGSQLSNLVYHRGQGLDRPVAAGQQRLSRLFAAADQSLLILGAPGSGKTITLLQLLDELLQQAKGDAEAPIPLLFNLSSFGTYAQEKDANLLNWLANQAYDQYRLKRDTTREQLAAENQFILLLDGLDEVPEVDGRREQCVSAINTFAQTHPCGLVVCSRIGDYEALQNKLAVSHALVLQPLTNQQIEQFIEQVGNKNRAAMLAQLQTDWQLREALRSPLLLNLYPQAFATLATSLEENSVTDTVETRRKVLFAAYVDTVFAAQTDTATTRQDNINAKEKSVPWLSFLSNRMQQTGRSLFFIEEMQPTWLPQPLLRRYRGLYGLLNGLIVGLIFGLLFRLYEGLVFGYYREASEGLELIVVLIVGLGVGVTWLTTYIRQPKLRILVGGLIVGLFVGLIFGLSGVLNFESRDGIEMIVGLSNGLIVGLIFGLGVILSIGILSSWFFAIQLREQLSFLWPSRQRIWRHLRRGIIYGLIGGLFVGLFYGVFFGLSNGLTRILLWPSDEPELSVLIRELIHGLRRAGPGWVLRVWLFIGLIGIILAFMDTPLVDKRPKPGQGIRASLKNALRITFMAALFFGLPTLLYGKLTAANYFYLLSLVLINILPPTFSWFGGLAWCQHVALRVVIARQGWLPLRLISWLDSMVELGLLRRVGGGYIFIHRSLLEYFAELEEWPEGAEIW